MIDQNTALLILVAILLGIVALFLRASIKKAKNLTKFQKFSDPEHGSLLETGIYTEHGIVYNIKDRSISPQHKRSNFFYESIM